MESIISIKKDKCMILLKGHLQEKIEELINHTNRVNKICEKIIEYLDIDEETKELIYKSAIFHDICKFEEDRKTENHNELAKCLLSELFEKDKDLDKICLIIKYHKGDFNPAEDIAIPSAILRMADKIDKFNKNKNNAEKKYEKSIKKIKKHFEKNDIKKFKKFKKACEIVKKETIDENN